MHVKYSPVSSDNISLVCFGMSVDTLKSTEKISNLKPLDSNTFFKNTANVVHQYFEKNQADFSTLSHRVWKYSNISMFRGLCGHKEKYANFNQIFVFSVEVVASILQAYTKLFSSQEILQL